MTKKVLTVNVDSGFLPSFASRFREEYGEMSLFVRAASDALTQRLVRLMKAKGRLKNPDSVALFASPAAVDCLESLLSRVHDGMKHLSQEAGGFTPLGTFREAVDSSVGSGTFSAWLNRFEHGDFAGAEQVVQRRIAT